MSEMVVLGKKTRILFGVMSAVGLGLLEANWVVVGSHQTAVWLGVIGIFLALFAAVYPYAWWIPALAILEEGTHLFFGYHTLPTYDTIFHHWSVGLLGFNIYPWISFPLITIATELIFRKRRRRRQWAR